MILLIHQITEQAYTPQKTHYQKFIASLFRTLKDWKESSIYLLRNC